MRDLYNRSIGEPAHFSEQSAPDVNSWWTCLIAGGLIQQIMLGMILIQAVSNLYFTTPPIANLVLGIFAMLLLSGSAFFLQRIVSTITRGQLSGLGLHQTFA